MLRLSSKIGLCLKPLPKSNSFRSISHSPWSASPAVTQTQDKAASPISKEPREIQIPVPWGHISGKLWGSETIQPILAFHGWQDNAGTFDTLAPLFPEHLPILAIDIPGHGLSSHFHPGRGYHFLEYVVAVRRIMLHYGWERVSFLGHSMGSILSFVFSCLYPDMVHNYVAIDALKPYSYKPVTSVRRGGKFIDDLLKVHKFDVSKAPTYDYETARDRLVKGTHCSITPEASKFLLARGLEEVVPGRFRYRRDSRLKIEQMMSWTHVTLMELASHIRCNVCHINADPGLSYDSAEKHEAVNAVVAKNAKTYEYHNVPGTHHLHLTHPETVFPIILDFYERNKVKV